VTNPEISRLEDAQGAVDYRGGHVQTIAPAGSGMTQGQAKTAFELAREGTCPRSS
jgi:hypothetical protein